jgi:NADPH-dependent glutamate synthase beta subunit-like oxidoreductase
MGKVTGFLEYERQTPERRPVSERTQDFFSVYLPFSEDMRRGQSLVVWAISEGRQAARAMHQYLMREIRR